MCKDPMGSDSINIRLTSREKRNNIYMDRRRARKMYYEKLKKNSKISNVGLPYAFRHFGVHLLLFSYLFLLLFILLRAHVPIRRRCMREFAFHLIFLISQFIEIDTAAISIN